MTVEVVNGLPPPDFYRKVCAAFPAARARGTIFSYGDRIFHTGPGDLPQSLLAHEYVHCARQRTIGLAEWWDRYIADPLFRLDEEIPAHVAEYKVLTGKESVRAERRRAMKLVAGRLSGPLYRHLITYDQAKEILLSA